MPRMKQVMKEEMLPPTEIRLVWHNVNSVVHPTEACFLLLASVPQNLLIICKSELCT
jgi:hypothetical protein